MRTALVTVGSTSFDRLIRKLHTSQVLLTLVKVHKITHLIIQYGNGKYKPPSGLNSSGITMTSYAYKPSLAEDMQCADLVISHAGAGSVIEALSRGKKLVVVVNRDLMDDHQKELADVVESEGYAYKADVDCLEEVLKRADFDSRKPFPERNKEAVSGVLKQELA